MLGKIEDFGMLLYLTSMLYDMTQIEKYYFPETKEIAEIFISAMKNLKCETDLDKRAKSILKLAFVELKEAHTISDGVFKVLNSTRLEYLNND